MRTLTPLTTRNGVARAALLVALLLGGLFPTVGGISVTLIAAALTVPVIGYELLRWLPRVHPVVWFVPPVFLTVLFPMLYTPPATAYGDDKMLRWVTLTLVSALAATLIRDTGTLTVFAKTWTVAGLLLAVAALAGFEGGRADGFESNPIWVARALAVALLFVMWLTMQKQVRVPIAAATVGMLLAGIIATGSRGPLLAVTAGAVILAIASGTRRAVKVAAITATGVAAYWAVTTLPFFADSRLRQLLLYGDSDQSREIFWGISTPLIESHPWGVGVGNWAAAARPPAQFQYPHNLFLEVTVELGLLVGVLLIGTVITVGFALAVKANSDPASLLLLSLLVCETIQVSVSGDLNARVFWFLLTLAFITATRTLITPTATLATPQAQPRAAQSSAAARQ